MPRGVLVVFSQRGHLPASLLCSLGSLVFTADLLLEAFHPCGTTLDYGVHLALPAPRSGIPLCLYVLFILPYISPIYPSPLVYWLCHTFMVYQLDPSLIRAKASPLPLSLVPLFWALSPPLGIPLHWLGYGLQPSNPCLPLAASSTLFHLLLDVRFFIHLSMPWAQIPPHDHYSLPTHGQPFDRPYIKPVSLFVGTYVQTWSVRVTVELL